MSLGECIVNIVSRSEDKNNSDFLTVVPLCVVVPDEGLCFKPKYLAQKNISFFSLFFCLLQSSFPPYGSVFCVAFVLFVIQYCLHCPPTDIAMESAPKKFLATQV